MQCPIVFQSEINSCATQNRQRETLLFVVRSVLFGAASLWHGIPIGRRCNDCRCNRVQFTGNSVSLLFPACVKHTSKNRICRTEIRPESWFRVNATDRFTIFICSLRFFHSCELYIVLVRSMWFGSQTKNVFQKKIRVQLNVQ